MSLLHAGPSAASPRLYCALARGRAEPGPSAASSRFHCARARGRAVLGPGGCPTSPPLCPGLRTGQTRLGPYTTPAGGRTPAGLHHRRGNLPSWRTLSDRQVRGTDSDTSWRRRGRRSRAALLGRHTCGPGPDALPPHSPPASRPRAGTTAAAGPGRLRPVAELAGLDRRPGTVTRMSARFHFTGPGQLPT